MEIASTQNWLNDDLGGKLLLRVDCSGTCGPLPHIDGGLSAKRRCWSSFIPDANTITGVGLVQGGLLIGFLLVRCGYS